MHSIISLNNAIKWLNTHSYIAWLFSIFCNFHSTLHVYLHSDPTHIRMFSPLQCNRVLLSGVGRCTACIMPTRRHVHNQSSTSRSNAHTRFCVNRIFPNPPNPTGIHERLLSACAPFKSIWNLLCAISSFCVCLARVCFAFFFCRWVPNPDGGKHVLWLQVRHVQRSGVPDGQMACRWNGNLKQFRIGVVVAVGFA